jgi:hypothetical protein
MNFGYIISIIVLQIVNAKPNGLKLKQLIDCFADYMTEASLRPDNSQVQNCNMTEIRYCKTDSGYNDHFCKFTGDNHLELDELANPLCYFNCQMETCNAWDIAHSDHQQECIDDLYID